CGRATPSVRRVAACESNCEHGVVCVASGGLRPSFEAPPLLGGGRGDRGDEGYRARACLGCTGMGDGPEQEELRGLAEVRGCELVVAEREPGGWRAAFRQSGSDRWWADSETREGALRGLRDAIALDDLE